MKIDKISFLYPNEDNVSKLLSGISEEKRQRALEALDFYLSLDTEVAFAFAVFGQALLVRCFDGEEYFFDFPHAVCEGADIAGAVEKCVQYSVLEEIEPVFVGVPSDAAGLFFSLGYRHINADSDSPESDTYRITLKNECSFLLEIPEADDTVVFLSALGENDKENYVKLCRNAENNKYWGYDFREDYDGCSDSFLLELAAREFDASVSVPFAVRAEGILVGEAVISSFDFKGGADISIRILPMYQNKGYAKRTLSLLFEIARGLSLVTLYARADAKNLPSLALFSESADERSEEGGVVVFGYKLN